MASFDMPPSPKAGDSHHWRVIDDKVLIVLVVKIGHRRDVYRAKQ